MHHLQSFIVALLVFGCSAYAAWTLLPAVARRGLAKQLLRMHWAAPVATRLRRAASTSSGCGCDGCDAPTAPRGVSGGVQKIVIVPRRR